MTLVCFSLIRMYYYTIASRNSACRSVDHFLKAGVCTDCASSLIFVHKGNYLAHYMHNNNHLAGIAIGSNCLCNLFPLAKILSEQKRRPKITKHCQQIVGLKIPQNSSIILSILLINYIIIIYMVIISALCQKIRNHF